MSTYSITVYDKGLADLSETIPKPLRAVIIGSSGCGKTTLLMNFIYKDWVNFKNLYVFSKSLDQPLYQNLIRRCENVENTIGTKIAEFYGHMEDLVPVEECKPDSLIVFDDCIMEKQNEIKKYFIMGRHKNISCIYLSQCYSLVNLQVIRNNLNFVCLFKQNKYYLRKIYEDFVGSDMQFNNFCDICYDSWNEPFGFLTINLTNKSGRYKKQFQPIEIAKERYLER